MTLSNNFRLPVSHVSDLATQAFSGVPLHELNLTEWVEVRNFEAERVLAFAKTGGGRVAAEGGHR